MKLGVSVSPREIGSDPVSVRDFVQAVEGAGFDHVLTGEHVLGVHPDRHRPPETLHSYDTPWFEPFVFFAFVAACTTRLELVSSVLVLPLRQTAVVAKQAAMLDALSNGRLRLGVGVGRNSVEFEALDSNYKNRGRRIEEQIALLRALWTQELVTFEGRYHHIDRMAINPLPVQRPIPLWMGTTFSGVVEKALERVARLADGWFPQFPPNDETRAIVERFRQYARDAGRDPNTIGIEAGLRASAADGPEAWIKTAQAWKDLGATHLRIGLAGDYASPQSRIDTLSRVREALKGL
ncbi:MAG TPA: LLM class F420-dependent oxidoreductase [Dehalococcoidia bacterium]|nr:LLM class F420-dependent oxidoreductase [Dehalococcoidia bacterium]